MREHERLAAALERELDRDIAAITDYLVGALAIEDVHEVERRLENDPAFREIAEPIIVTWRAARSTAEDDITSQDVEEALADVRARSRGRALDLEVRLAIRIAERRARRVRRRLFVLALVLVGIGVPLVLWLVMGGGDR